MQFNKVNEVPILKDQWPTVDIGCAYSDHWLNMPPFDISYYIMLYLCCISHRDAVTGMAFSSVTPLSSNHLDFSFIFTHHSAWSYGLKYVFEKLTQLTNAVD